MRSCEKLASSGRLRSSSAVPAMPDCCATALAAACCPAPLLPRSAAVRMTAAACLLMSEMVCRDPSSSLSLDWEPYTPRVSMFRTGSWDLLRYLRNLVQL